MCPVLRAPWLGMEEKELTVARWLVAEGAAFRRGEAILVVETLKAAFEVEAEEDGVLWKRLAPERAKVPFDAPLALWGRPGETPTMSEVEPARAHSPEAAATPAAGNSGAQGAAHSPLAEPPARSESQGSAPRGDGRLDPAFLAHLRANAEAFGRLSSAFRLDLYRRHGAVVGRDVELGTGVVLCAARLVLGDGVRFGEGCTLDAVDAEIGALSQFGARCRVRARHLLLGENAFFATDVEIGGGGCMDPEAELVVGSHGFVGEHVHLNPCRRLAIGDEVVISRGAVLMTHSFGGSVLDGSPNRFAPLEVGDRAQIGIGAVLFPGVSVGAGAVVLSGSSLVTSVAPGRLVGGVPARDLKAASTPPSPEARATLARSLVLEFARQLELRGCVVLREERGASLALAVERDGRSHRLRFDERLDASEGDLAAEDVRIGMACDDGAFSAIPNEVAAFDLGALRVRGVLGPLAAAFREFLRKRGVRLDPKGWCYRGGWL